ncbi:hypothetical protein [Nocardia nova]|uniref:hypothetical protein n=1 Tax=Nocardia nova TaxID=37330 RepID=UPI0033F16FB3
MICGRRPGLACAGSPDTLLRLAEPSAEADQEKKADKVIAAGFIVENLDLGPAGKPAAALDLVNEGRDGVRICSGRLGPNLVQPGQQATELRFDTHEIGVAKQRNFQALSQFRN